MKRFATVFISCLLFPLMLSAQEEAPATGPVASAGISSKFSASLNAGMTFSFMDVNESKSAPVFGIGAQYLPSPWIGINLDVQSGALKSGDRNNKNLYYMEFKNNFIYSSLTGRFYPLRLALKKKMDADVATNIKYLGGIYGGVGLGFIFNKVEAYASPAPDVELVANPDGADFVLPLEIGYSLPIAQVNASYAKGIYGRSLLSLNINYRHNFGFSEKMDGYDPIGNANDDKDVFSTLTIGLVYNF